MRASSERGRIQKLEIEKQQKEPLAAQLRELGINPHKILLLGYYIMNL